MEYSSAHRLAQDIRNSEEYRTYHALKETVNADETTAALLREYRKLSVKFTLSVNVKRRIAFVIWLPGAFPLPIKHIIRTNVHHLTAQSFAGPGNIFRADCVNRHHKRPFIFLFRRIYCGPGGAVNYGVRRRFLQCVHNSVCTGYIQLPVRHARDSGTGRGSSTADPCMPPPSQFQHNVVA